MIIKFNIHRETENSTVSKVYINNEFFGYTLEDGFNFPKIWGETRIGHGIYEIEARRAGKFYRKYKQRYGHDFAIWVRHVVNYLWVMIHIGNYTWDTHGCPLIGSGYRKKNGEYMVTSSTRKYKKLYTRISLAFDRKEKVLLVVDRSKSQYEKREPIQYEKILDK